jgi:hypothetical protein
MYKNLNFGAKKINKTLLRKIIKKNALWWDWTEVPTLTDTPPCHWSTLNSLKFFAFILYNNYLSGYICDNWSLTDSLRLRYGDSLRLWYGDRLSTSRTLHLATSFYINSNWFGNNVIILKSRILLLTSLYGYTIAWWGVSINSKENYIRPCYWFWQDDWSLRRHTLCILN